MASTMVAIEQDNNHWVVGASSVQFKKSAPGGDVSASFRVTWGHWIKTLRSEAEVYISDRSSGKILWYGRVTNPGTRTQAQDGYLDVTCDGSMVTLDQEKKLRPYVVTRYSAWDLSDTASTYPQGATIEVGPMSTKTDDGQPTNDVYVGMTLMVPKGAPVKPWFGPNRNFYKDAAVKARCYCFDNTGYWIGSFACYYRNYGDSNNWVTRAHLENSLGTQIFSDSIAQNESVFVSWYRGRDQSNQQTPMSIQLSFDTAAHDGKDGRYAPAWHDGSDAGHALNYDLSPPQPNLNGDYLAAPMPMYASFNEVSLVAHLWDRRGLPLAAMPNRPWLRPYEIIEDILGRDLLNQFTRDDSYSVVSAVDTTPIKTLDYTERAVSTREVLDDLVEVTGGRCYYVSLPPRNPGELPGLSWRTWHPVPRYATMPDADIDLTGAQRGLINRVSVRWRDPYGRVITRQYTAHPDKFPDTLDLGDFYPDLWRANPGDPPGISSVTNLYNPALGWSRIVEDEPIDLAEDRASPEVADSVAHSILEAQARRERSGTVAVTRVMDLWESGVKPARVIEPGYSLYISDTAEVIRVTDVEYDDETGISKLSVANPGLAISQLITQSNGR